ncbi:MAG: DNA polymerase III subunit delta [Candidatus Obscuribacterales bacterium]|nr:DNA polymerase III subunit delta [Candidatus Obscuribacterales bacterium]
MPAIVLAGEEELLIAERLDTLKAELLDPAWSNFNFSCIENPDLKQAIDAAATVPFGLGNKIVLLDRCDFFTKKRGKSDDEAPTGKKAGKDKLLEDLDQALAAIAPNTYLIFRCNANFDKTLKTSKVMEKHGEIEHFPKIKFWSGSNNPDMLNWGRKRAHKHGAVIDDQAIDYLAESSEGNLRMIAMEIEKTATYIYPEKRITLEHVAQLSPHYSNVFALLDHWIAGRQNKVIENIEEILGKQQSAIPIFAVLQTTFSKWINIKTASERVLSTMPAGRGIQRRELPAAEMAKKLPDLGINPWVLKLELERLSKLTLESLINKKSELTRLEDMVKSGQIKEFHALSLFFTN